MSNGVKIKKKAWPESFQAVLDGRKKFELRLADFKIKEGDVLVLREWDPAKKDYTGRSLEKTVGYVLKMDGLKYYSQTEIDKFGYQIISLR
jgi:hypothetical protein